MWENPVNRVRWSGERSIGEVEERLRQLGHVEIQLPPDFHHAIFVRVHPNATDVRVEHIDVSDGVDLLRTVASVRGLNELAALETTVRERHLNVHLLSPVPLIILTMPPHDA